MASLTYSSMKSLRLMSHLSKLPLRHLSVSTTKTYLNNSVIKTKAIVENKPHDVKVSYSRKKFLSSTEYCQLCGACSARNYSTKTSRFTLGNETYRKYLTSLEEECKALSSAQAVGQILGQQQGHKLRLLRGIVDIFEALKVKYDELEELNQMQRDEEMKELVRDEKQTCCAEIEELEEKLVDIVCPDEHIDECDIILEVESGAGGQESMLFAQEVFEMYQNFAQSKGWQFDITHVTRNTNSDEGVRKVSASISGQGVFGEMKYEGGIHRVQRIPKTESKGRVHTSTISVAVLPQPSEIDIVLDPKDLQVDTFKSSGAGGQHVQKTDSAVRIKHLPTGMTAECQMSRSQIKNKKTALVILRTRLYEHQLKEITSKTTSQRKIQVGNKDRSEKIRTYNFSQDRITDHRLGHNFNNIPQFMSGVDSLQKMIKELQEEAKLENLHILLDEFEQPGLKRKTENN
ncbi:peptide chain release factor 1-like, mitochondrial [Mercenaria mercenaria]|uniref:peptide chain release factor 1-like, mitochondrial n=1 Tax=Mercenaria mercenaria TaxID=6596 RepID=UPI00234F7125|nr:peptide chain release factor 1-like, mitochondrial [Mercenaria mercenaria]XP_053384556.1 peptide chain release factor 1-like, mitochondrial [Mercenaria mercenaria]XP_053384557.1 peptide chain release factor 1-like, mitochondrial [Mercenaria mercenaria]